MKRPRIAYFLLGVVGGLLAGGGAVSTWRTIEMGGVVTTKGIDTLVGKIALALSVATIILVLITRKGTSEEPRGWPIHTVLVAGVLLLIIGGLPAAHLDAIYQDTRKADAIRISEALNEAGHDATAEDVLKQMDAAEARKPGPGPWILLVGALVVICAALSGLAWKRRWDSEAQGSTPFSEPSVLEEPGGGTTPTGSSGG